MFSPFDRSSNLQHTGSLVASLFPEVEGSSGVSSRSVKELASYPREGREGDATTSDIVTPRSNQDPVT